MRKSVYETNYQRLIKLGVVGESIETDHRVSKSGGYMDFEVRRIPHNDDMTGNKGVALSIAHYFEQNGDLCSDPYMEIIVYPDLESVEAVIFSQSIPHIFNEVYPEPGKFYPRRKKELNDFLRSWLTNLINQNHGKEWIIK